MLAETIPTLEEQNNNNRKLIELEIGAAGITTAGKAMMTTLLKEALPLYWQNTAQYQGFPDLRKAYATRLVLRYLVFSAFPQFNFKEADVEEEREQIMLNLQRIYDNVEAEIKVLEMRGNGETAGGAVGAHTTTAPLPVPGNPPQLGDPNDQRYLGEARRRSFPFGRW